MTEPEPGIDVPGRDDPPEIDVPPGVEEPPAMPPDGEPERLSRILH